MRLDQQQTLRWPVGLVSRFILGRLGQVWSVPRERDCQINMLHHMIAEARNRL
jgi:hypothetical protein